MTGITRSMTWTQRGFSFVPRKHASSIFVLCILVVVIAGLSGVAGQEPSHSEEMVKKLLVQLQNDDELIQLKAIASLEALGPKAKSAIPYLIDAFKKQELARRATLALIQIGQEAFRPCLIAFGDENEVVRANAIDAIVGLKCLNLDEIESLIDRGLKDRSRQVRFNTLVALSIYSRSDKMLPRLVEAMRDEREDREFRMRAIFAIACLREKATPSIPAIDRLFRQRSNDPILRGYALATLTSIAPKNRNIFENTLSVLKDENEDARVREAAVEVLSRSGDAGRIAIPTLCKLVRNQCGAELDLRDINTSGHIRKAALEALRVLRPGKNGIDLALNLLDNVECESCMQLGALDLLSSMGRDAESAIPGLLKFMKANDDIIFTELVLDLIPRLTSKERALALLHDLEKTTESFILARSLPTRILNLTKELESEKMR